MNIDPQTPEEALAWIFAREFPIERGLKLPQMLRRRLTRRGFTNVEITVSHKHEWRVQMEEGTSGFEQLYEVRIRRLQVQVLPDAPR